VLAEFDGKEKATRERQLKWWAARFAGLSLAEISADRISQERDALATETFTRGKPQTNKKTGMVIPPKEYTRTGATVNRYIASLSHALSFAVKERRLIDRNPVSDISRKKEPTRLFAEGVAGKRAPVYVDVRWRSFHFPSARYFDATQISGAVRSRSFQSLLLA
jgi:hypothetical protein